MIYRSGFALTPKVTLKKSGVISGSSKLCTALMIIGHRVAHDVNKSLREIPCAFATTRPTEKVSPKGLLLKAVDRRRPNEFGEAFPKQ